MLREHTKKVLLDFANAVEQQAIANKGSKIDGWESKVDVHPNSITLSMEMSEYLHYQDEGVQGAGVKLGARKTTSRFNKSNNKGKMWKNKAKGSRFAFASGKPQTNTDSIMKKVGAWASSKGLNPFAVAKSVYMQGIPPSRFMTKALEKEFKTLPDEITEAYGLDINKFLEFAFKDSDKSINKAANGI